MRIGIFAGTFDPIHTGHIAFAESAIREANLDKVIIVAEKEPYRKKPHATWDHRQAMIERAAESIEQVDHDYKFAAELSHQHTLKDTMQNAYKHYGKDNEYWFLVGSDIFEHLHKWQDLISSEQYGGFVVSIRHGHVKQSVLEKSTEAGLPSNKIIFVSNPHPELSSSKLRQDETDGVKSTALSPKVVEYIHVHHLYEAA